MSSDAIEAKFDPDPEEFDTILDAVMETPRGRWFLNEYAKRNRVSDTEQLLLKLERLNPPSIKVVTPQRGSFKGLAEVTNLLNAALSAIEGAIPGTAPEPSDAYGLREKFEQSAKDMQTAAENLQELTERLKNDAVDSELCDQVQAEATKIFMASSLHDMTNGHAVDLLEAAHVVRRQIHDVLRLIRPDAAPAEARDDESLVREPQSSTRPVAVEPDMPLDEASFAPSGAHAESPTIEIEEAGDDDFDGLFEEEDEDLGSVEIL